MRMEWADIGITLLKPRRSVKWTEEARKSESKGCMFARKGATRASCRWSALTVAPRRQLRRVAVMTIFLLPGLTVFTHGR